MLCNSDNHNLKPSVVMLPARCRLYPVDVAALLTLTLGSIVVDYPIKGMYSFVCQKESLYVEDCDHPNG